MSPAVQKLPAYLKKYLAEQDYERYTPQDHAAWRYIMRQNRAFFSKHAAPVYLEGLKKTGVPIDRIPRIAEMDECLSRFGWGAVPVRGFIPPAAFLDFQARGVLPIASDMRTVDHLAYTPAPDIVHEAAGHAPIIAEPSYAAYLHRYAKMAQKAIQTAEDICVYEAIRYLSDVKENPDMTPAQIAEAEQRLVDANKAVTHVSEATKVARMAWWTVEYGLVGKKAPLIYGAGLLSSVGESRACLSDKVRKIPLTIDCVEQSYDITEPQPQLFVTPDMEHLHVVLDDLERTLAFVIGGAEGLRRAKLAQTVNTVVLDSGLEVSGRVDGYLGDVEFFKLAGPVQLAHAGAQLAGHGRERHPTGFSSPLGRWVGAEDRPADKLSDGDLKKLGIERGKAASLKLTTGFVVKGNVLGTTRDAGGNLIIVTFGDCSVTRGGETFFEPSWGELDLAVGEKVTSVHGGPADWASYGEIDIGTARTAPSRTTPHTVEETAIFDIYRRLRAHRERGEGDMLQIAKDVAKYPKEWLLSLEAMELGANGELRALLEKNGDQRDLIQAGLALVGVAD